MTSLSRTSEMMNILLLIIDALRPDHLGACGYSRETSPNIDKLANEGVVFLNAYCTLPRSDPSITSMLTGNYPYSHGVRMITNNKVDPSISTLPEILKSHGYRTGFIKPGTIPPEGYSRGFDDYDLVGWKIKNKIKRGIFKIKNPGNFLGPAAQRFSTAVKWINKNAHKKFFLAVHTHDLHWPYPVPKPYDHIFDPGYKGAHTFADLGKGTISRGDLSFGVKKLPKEEIDHAIAHYDGGIKYVDESLKTVFDALKEKNIYDDTLIIIVSDHGEHFDEHGYYFQHGASLYEPSVKSTFIMRYPKRIPQKKIIESRVQLLDITPTILDILNIPLIEKKEGVSLMPLIDGKVNEARDFVFVEGIEEYFSQHKRIYLKGIKGKWRMIIVGDWKLIYIPHPEKNIFELYNLRQDPKEESNLVGKEQEIFLSLKTKLFDFLSLQSNEGEVNIKDLSQKSRQLLIKAGYLEK
ncbi:MAG TPA: sulfatase [Candidatus Nanoarchaeia archaeon]|nr:sulfatase [Candidatus Nanoarchaeia archaeon]